MNAPLTNIPENVRKLTMAAQAPGPLKDALLAQRATLDLPGLVALASTHGVDVSAAELETFAASQPVPSELSDEALGSVTGGVGGGMRSLIGQLLRFVFDVTPGDNGVGGHGTGGPGGG